MLIALLGTAVYALITGIAVVRSWPHYELLGLFLRYAVLLPAIVYCLRLPGPGNRFGLPGRRSVLIIIAGFLVITAALNSSINRGQMIPDEGSYRFQARIIAAGKIFAPPPVGTNRVGYVPRPVRFNHLIVSGRGWYSKYPLGWPAVLALPEKLHLGWLVNPVLGALLLAIIGLVARETFGPAAVAPAVVIAALSPYFFANSVGRMSHALCGVLVAWASLLCIQGLKTGALSRFAGMFLLLVPTFHVRPFTALVASIVLGLGALIATRNRRPLFLKVAAFGIICAVVAISSFLLYNRLFTGSAFLSPYALQRGVAIPPELRVTPAQLAHNLESMWRFALQQTLLFSFPLIVPLVIYRVWACKLKSATERLLLILPCALIVAHLVQFESSASIFGERYWSEGYFGIVVLAAGGFTHLLSTWRPERSTVLPALIGLLLGQLVIMAATVMRVEAATEPTREVRRLAERYSNCDCVVFLKDNAPSFHAEHLNLNGPDWPSARVFFAVDPGPDKRAKWAAALHKPRWLVLSYDPEHHIGIVDTPIQ